jgi:hypothetical protein
MMCRYLCFVGENKEDTFLACGTTSVHVTVGTSTIKNKGRTRQIIVGTSLIGTKFEKCFQFQIIKRTHDEDSFAALLRCHAGPIDSLFKDSYSTLWR